MSNLLTKSKARRLFVACLLITCAVCVGSGRAGGLIGSADYQECLVTDVNIECDEAMALSLAVSYGLGVNVELLTLAPQGEPEQAVQLEIEKSRPRVIYPLKHFHTVAYYPHEDVIKVTDGSTCAPGCDDSSTAQCPTCGWTSILGSIVEDSQGFCSMRHVLEEATGSWWRGETLLGEQATLSNPFSTAHCMKPGAFYFDGYEIGAPIKTYDLAIKIIQGSEEHTFVLSPESPLYSTRYDTGYSGTFNLHATLLGDMEPYKAVCELDNHILYIPSAPVGHEMVTDYQNNMLLVPREEVSRDGGEGDKVGVSFYTFRRLAGDSAVSKAGDGLGNQLFHKHDSDLQKLTVNPNAETTYLVHGKRFFKGSMMFTAGMPKYLEHRIDDINYSMLRLAIDKGTVKTITKQSKGIILNAAVETFESMSKNGLLKATVKNIGDYETNYIVTVTKPTLNIIKTIPAQARVLQPDEEVTFTFDISTAFNLDTTNEFLVTLKAPHGETYDSVWVRFDTTDHDPRHSWDLQMENKASQVGEPPISLLGDGNCDGQVDYKDMVLLADSWLHVDPTGFVDMGDLAVVAQCWMEGV